jgi:hypothetical protein
MGIVNSFENVVFDFFLSITFIDRNTIQKYNVISAPLNSVIHYTVQFHVTILNFGSFPCRGNDGILLFATASIPALGPTQPPIQWVPRALTPGVKWRKRETDH